MPPGIRRMGRETPCFPVAWDQPQPSGMRSHQTQMFLNEGGKEGGGMELQICPERLLMP